MPEKVEGRKSQTDSATHVTPHAPEMRWVRPNLLQLIPRPLPLGALLVLLGDWNILPFYKVLGVQTQVIVNRADILVSFRCLILPA